MSKGNEIGMPKMPGLDRPHGMNDVDSWLLDRVQRATGEIQIFSTPVGGLWINNDCPYERNEQSLDEFMRERQPVRPEIRVGDLVDHPDGPAIVTMAFKRYVYLRGRGYVYRSYCTLITPREDL